MPEIIYGRNPVIEALRAGKSVGKIFIAEGIKGQIISEIAVLAKRNGVPVERVSKQKLIAVLKARHTRFPRKSRMVIL